MKGRHGTGWHLRPMAAGLVSTPEPFADLFDEGRFVGELPRGDFRVNRLAIDGQFETSSPGRFEFHSPDLLLVGAQNLLRQTDGFRLVVSSRAVTKMDLHDVIPSCSELHGEKTDAWRNDPQGIW